MPIRIHPLKPIPIGRLWRVCVLTVAVIGLVAVGSMWAPAGGGDRFRALPSEAVAPDPYFNGLFTRYDGGWTGGDGTYSVQLPDERTLWMFGDSFVGRVAPDRSRSKHSPLINNCFVVQQNGDLVTLHGGSSETPRALVAPPDADSFYWPGDGTVANGRLQVFFNRFRRSAENPWQWQWLGTDVFDFRLPDIQRVARFGVEAANRVMYGSAIFEDGQNVYVYGTEDLKQVKHLHVARFPVGGLEQPWQYFTGSGWSSEAEKSARLLSGIANQFSVVAFGRRYLLITTDNRSPFSPTILAYVAPAPTGPWKPGVRLYDPPEAAGDVVAYNALAHPQFSSDGRLLVSYNLNHAVDFEALYRDADLYRPRFIRVQLSRVGECLDAE
jgi:hypothetical protein